MQDEIKPEWIEAARRAWHVAIDENGLTDWRRVLAAVAPLIRAEAEAERDEADRRAGAAERRAADLQEGANARASWLYRAKRERGYHDNVSFDVVWAETCAKADRSDAALAQAQAQNEALRKALTGAREAILDLKNSRWSEAEGTDEEWVAEIDAALKEPSHDH